MQDQLQATGSQTVGPLHGVRVLELGHFVAAPFATRLLGDLGADIIKVEPPGGDPVRQWGAKVGDSTPWWSVHARNKQCLSLDLKRPEARAIVLDLVRHCDALVENFRPGQLARMGLDEATLRTVRPDLVIARISGYGQDGPGRDRAAFGVIGEAIGGLRHLTNHAPGVTDLPPVRVGVSLGDSLAGMYAALGVVSALWRRDRRSEPPGPGANVDVALSEAVLSLLEGALPEYGSLGSVRQPSGGGIATAAPSNAYRSRDGVWMLIAANSEPLFRRLAVVMGQPELADDPRFIGNQARVRHVQILDGLIATWTGGLDIAALETILSDADIPSTRVYTIADCANDAQFQHRGMIRPTEDPLLGSTLHPGVVPRVDAFTDPLRFTGPAVNAHADQVLQGLLGYSAERMQALRDAGVV